MCLKYLVQLVSFVYRLIDVLLLLQGSLDMNDDDDDDIEDDDDYDDIRDENEDSSESEGWSVSFILFEVCW